jgi:glutamate-1-semialdehyde 2,1-aminomutase
VPSSYGQMMAGDKARFNSFFHGMLDEGVYFAPAMFEAGFVSAAHDDAVIDRRGGAHRRLRRVGGAPTMLYRHPSTYCTCAHSPA